MNNQSSTPRGADSVSGRIKTCIHCHKEKPVEEYVLVKGYRHGNCNECRLAKQRSYNRKRQQIKKSNKLW